MKLSLIALLLSAALLASAAEPPIAALNFHALSARWAKRPAAEVEADAARGDAVAQFYLSQLLLTGRGVPRDDARGLILLRQSATQGNAEAMAELGRRQLFGEGLPENFDEALRLARAAASRSNGAGLHLLGQLQASGIGMAADAAAAFKLYEQAAAAGSPVAMRTIGRIHLEGRFGFKPDAAEANRCYHRAAEAGLPAAMNAYGYSLFTGRGVPKDTKAGLNWILRAAANGEVGALRMLGEQGQLDAATQLAAWRDAARAGNADALFRLARLLATGELEPKDSTETPHRLLQAAAEGEHIEAALMLGDRYRWGYGGPRDLVAASRWFLHGASFVGGLGDTSAKLSISGGSKDPALPGGLNNWFDEGNWKARRSTPDDALLAEVMDHYLRAAEARDAAAMRVLAGFYQRGQHVPKDPVEASAWLLLARQHSPAAAAEADAALRSLSPEHQQQARARVRQLIKRTL
ncbi:MAG: Sel1 repeat-containing protein [Limisphaerales bacterium]|nr:MAG: Sel1 repeat-containing protein [Limisphaerales bacterium]KAG0508894.1 MAG: Sel1 repeat-containing protein [Limisphaerales bacterium]TXT50235.1 MAG: Sel1 repeat-containing protein [Limisphaerales bacterium]